MDTNDWNDAERRVERAQELFEQHKWEEALEELQAATSINPYNASWYFNIGLTLDEMRRHDEAIIAYEHALEIDPEDTQALHHLGLDLHQVGRFTDAIGCFERVEKVDPSFEPSYCARILSYTELGDHEKAEEMFYLARLFKEHCEQCYFHIGVSLSSRGLYDRAIFCFNRTLDRQSDWPEVHFRLARVFHQKSDFEQARRHYGLGLQQDPGSVDALLDLSELLIDMQRMEEAGEKIRRAIEISPEDPASHTAHGRWLMRRNFLADARQSFSRALELDPTSPSAHLNLGKIAFDAGEIESARRHLRGELLLRSDDPSTLHQLGNLLFDAGDSRAAAVCFKRLNQIRPDDVSAWLNLAVVQFARKRYEEGIANCKQAMRIEPRNLVAHFNLALAMSHLGYFDQAIEITRAGLKHWPRDAGIQSLEFRLRVLRLRDRFVKMIRRIVRACAASKLD